jgi:hypothetical protein
MPVRNVVPARKQDQEVTSYTLTMSPAANELWEDLQRESGESREAVLRKALGLLKLAYDARREGKHVGFSHDPAAFETEVEL